MSADAQVLPVVNAADHRKFPEVDADHTEMWVTVSEVPPLVHDGWVPVNAIAPEDAAENVTAERVVEPADTALVPLAPGSAVWICTYVAPMAKLLLRTPLSMALARLVVLSPTVMVAVLSLRCLLG